MEFKDYYKVMGVARDATEAQIKQAYRKLARKYHPDVSKEKDAEARFKEVGEAYEVLKSPEKRAAYDQLGRDRGRARNFARRPIGAAGFEFSGAGAGEIRRLQRFFRVAVWRAGGARAAAAARFIPDAAKIITRRCCSISRPRCAAARASSPCASRRSMPKAGWSRRSARSMSRCPRAYWPASIFVWRARARAHPATATGAPGDSYIEVEFQPHPLYRIDGRDLYLDLPVAPWEAALGATVKTPTPTGTVDLKIPAGLACRQQIAAEGPGHSGLPARRFLRGAANRAARRQRRQGQSRLRGHGRGTALQSSRQLSECKQSCHHRKIRRCSGAILEESADLTVKDLSRMCAVDERHIVEFVEEGVLNVVEVNTTEWHFTGAACGAPGLRCAWSAILN